MSRSALDLKNSTQEKTVSEKLYLQQKTYVNITILFSTLLVGVIIYFVYSLNSTQVVVQKVTTDSVDLETQIDELRNLLISEKNLSQKLEQQLDVRNKKLAAANESKKVKKENVKDSALFNDRKVAKPGLFGWVKAGVYLDSRWKHSNFYSDRKSPEELISYTVKFKRGMNVRYKENEKSKILGSLYYNGRLIVKDFKIHPNHHVWFYGQVKL